MRFPAIPLFNIDPYFSVWSRDKINTRDCVHWTGSPNTIRGTVTVDGKPYCFLGRSPDPVIPQISLDVDVFSTWSPTTSSRAVFNFSIKYVSPGFCQQNRGFHYNVIVRSVFPP